MVSIKYFNQMRNELINYKAKFIFGMDKYKFYNSDLMKYNENQIFHCLNINPSLVFVLKMRFLV